MKNFTYFFVLLLMSIYGLDIVAQPAAPGGKKWQLISNMSDEFNGNSLDFTKWDDQDPQWRGRIPAIFKENTIKVADGYLKITNYKLSQPEGAYTHAGGMVRGIHKQTYGYYECKMKASRTFMSSTFWLFNKRNEGSGCDVRTTELDITETVGVNSNGASWVDRNIRSMNSNTHSRGTTCNDTPVGSEGGKADLGGNSWGSFHTYGVWWKSKNELLFYLDGKFVYKITPPADFNLPMYLRLVTETYDWNPVPADGGMTGSSASRTTSYDWVRSYKLVNLDGTEDDPVASVDTITLKNNPTTFTSNLSYDINVEYEASQNREIFAEFWKGNTYIKGAKVDVPAGKGLKTVTVVLDAKPESGSDYTFKTHIRPTGTTWREAIDADQIDNLTISQPLSVDKNELVKFSIFPNPTANGMINIKLVDNSPSSLNVYDILGNKVYSSSAFENGVNLSSQASGIYMIQITQDGKSSSKKLVLK